MIHTSEFWTDHFRENLKKQRIDWNKSPEISTTEKEEILYSLKAWQLGETSEGKHLMTAAGKYSRKSGDPEYLEAIKLFIKEEQKHGNNLGKYIDAIDEQRAHHDLGDSLFRFVRSMNTSMEIWTITVIIVESAAQIFYQALHDATQCPLLRSICADILKDEAHHIKFQNERLYQILNRYSFYKRAFSIGWYGALFFIVIHAIWFGHKRAFIAGGIERTEFMRKMYFKFFNTIRFVHQNESVKLSQIRVV